jgi:hypothetical protein
VAGDVITTGTRAADAVGVAAQRDTEPVTDAEQAEAAGVAGVPGRRASDGGQETPQIQQETPQSQETDRVALRSSDRVALRSSDRRALRSSDRGNPRTRRRRCAGSGGPGRPDLKERAERAGRDRTG